MRTALLLPALLMLHGLAQCQYNTAGRFHAALGLAVGGHGTSLEETVKLNILGVTVSRTSTKTGSAATTTLPLELGVGLGKAASLGLSFEVGRYVPDSNATDQTNRVAVVALQPRFFLINRDRFALSTTLQLGAALLHIVDDTPNEQVDARYSGPALGLGVGAHIPFSGHVGLDLHLRYLATRMELRAAELNGRSVMDYYQATLTTGGVLAQLGLSFRFGG